MTESTIGFIGLGLIGGSIARGLKRADKNLTIMAYMRSRDKLEQAKKDGIVDVILDGIDASLSQCDMIFLCTPVEFNASYLKKIRPFLKPGAILTDVGSTKTNIHKLVTELDMEDVFVGGHPMAGSEKTGYEKSSAACTAGRICSAQPYGRDRSCMGEFNRRSLRNSFFFRKNDQKRWWISP